MKENTIQYLKLLDTITIFVGRFKTQRILIHPVFRRTLHHMEMIENKFISRLPYFNTVWEHMIFGLKLKSATTTMPF